MSNRLAQESSPYLLQHKDNPVDWQPWGPEALALARSLDRPIFLSIGYAACHWCHVMAHESFEDPATAALMNAHFVNIKVDREERPDLDDIYMQSVVALTGQGGWPMSVFLTPEGEPFYGGTYFPPVRRYGMPSFQDVLTSVARAWREDRDSIRQQAGQLAAHLQKQLSGLPARAGAWTEQVLDQAALKLSQAYDWTNGGWGKAPKFPQPMTVEYLLQRAASGDSLALEIARHALDAMSRGGMYDVVGGGFARYSVDDRWLVPHFEKMLYDNAQLARAYLHAYLLTGESRYRKVTEETLDFILREMTHPTGGFYASLDADSEGEEGKFYVWSVGEVVAALPDAGLADFVMKAYGISETGNFEGHNVLQRQMDDAALAAAFDLPVEEVPRRLGEAHRLMRRFRERRVRPGTDDKCIAAWNGWMLITFSEAARFLDNERYADMAMRNGAFFLDQLRDPSGRLLRTWRDGQPGPAGFLEDYASAGLGLLSLFQTDPNPQWFTAAQQLTDRMITLFEDPNGGFFDTGADQEQLVVRPKNLQDNATPSGGSLAVHLLLRMAAYTGAGGYRDRAERALSPIAAPAAQYPTAFANWLCAAHLALRPLREVVLTGPDAAALEPLQAVLRNTYRPHLVSVTITGDPPTGLPPLAEDRPPVSGQATAYVCEGFTCLQPTTDPAEFSEQLREKQEHR